MGLTGSDTVHKLLTSCKRFGGRNSRGYTRYPMVAVGWVITEWGCIGKLDRGDW